MALHSTHAGANGAGEPRRDLGAARVEGGRAWRLNGDVDDRAAGSGIAALIGAGFFPVQDALTALQDCRHFVGLEIGAVMKARRAGKDAHGNDASDAARADKSALMKQPREDAPENAAACPKVGRLEPNSRFFSGLSSASLIISRFRS